MTIKTNILFMVGGAVIGLLTALAFSAMADGDPTTDNVPRMLPYQGTLEIDGQPVNTSGDPIPMMFSLFDGADAETAVYNQAVDIEVFNGRFTTTIGPVGQGAGGEDVAITTIIEAADDLYLGMTLLGEDPDSSEDDIPLSNRQRIHATPYAMWTTSATNLNVAVDLAVGRNLRVGGTTELGSGARAPDGAARLQLANNVAEGGVIDNYNDYQMLLHRTSSPASSYGIGIQPSTMFFNTDFDYKFYEDGALRLHLDSNTVRMQGNATINGNLDVGGTITGVFGISNETTLNRNNSRGTSSLNLGDANGRRICFLTRAGNEETDTGGEWAQCRVVVDGNQWKIRAELGNSSDADAYCGARCLTW